MEGDLRTVDLRFVRSVQAADPVDRRLRDLHARPDGMVTSWNAGRRADQGLHRPTRSSASISRASTPRRTARPASRARCSRPPRSEGKFEGEGWRVRKDGSRFWAQRRHRPDPRRRRQAHRLRQDHPRHDRAARGRRKRCARASSSSGCWSRASPTTRSSCSTRKGRSPTGTRAPSASRAIRRGRNRRPAFLAASTPTRTAQRACRRALEDRARGGPFRSRRLARAQGRHAGSGPAS